jgi:hypothetical protein
MGWVGFHPTDPAHPTDRAHPPPIFLVPVFLFLWLGL